MWVWDPWALVMIGAYLAVVIATAAQLWLIISSRYDTFSLQSLFLVLLLLGACDRVLLFIKVCAVTDQAWSHKLTLFIYMFPTCTDFAAYSVLVVFYARTAFGYAPSAAMDRLRARWSEEGFRRLTAGTCSVGNGLLLVGTAAFVLVDTGLTNKKHLRNWCEHPLASSCSSGRGAARSRRSFALARRRPLP